MAIDLRSDTVTQPSPAMRRAMFEADLGDDVYGEDPSVNRLEALAAGMLGKEAAVFVASGTMGNLVSLLAHCGRGQEAIVGDESHIYHYEVGSASALGGIVFHPVPTAPDGTLPLAAIEAAIRPSTNRYNLYHYAPPGVICLENTHNRCGGTVLAPDYFAEVAALAGRHGLPIHLDGARLFNAAVARDLAPTEWTKHVTSVQICLSKGLSAPVGSIIAGPAAFIDRARHMRKSLGGGMRQSGVLAAPGVLALTDMVDRLREDHSNARLLADGLSRIPGIRIDPSSVQTNIVVFHLGGPAEADRFALAAKAGGVLVSPFGPGRLRAVTHFGITADDCRTALDVLGRI
jgi:threonine aldolase